MYNENYESCLNDGMENWKITIKDDFRVEPKYKSVGDQLQEREDYKNGNVVVGRH